MLINYLRGTEGKAERKPVMSLVHKFELLSARLPKILPNTLLGRVQGRDAKIYRLFRDRRARQLVGEIQTILDLPRFSVRRLLDPTLIVAKGEEAIPTISVASKLGKFSRGGSAQITQPHAVDLVIELWNSGFLRVRRCKNAGCGQWFIALRPKKTYCETECFQQARGPKWREKMLRKNPDYFRTAMRKSRALHKKPAN